MPVITYTIQKSICKTVAGRKRWYYEYARIPVAVSSEVVAFLTEDEKRERRYRWKTAKQMRDAGISAIFSLDGLKQSDSEQNEDYPVAEIVEDTVHSDNRDPLEIILENEYEQKSKTEQERFAAELDKKCAAVMTKKQYEVWEYNKQGYRLAEIARHLGIDESSVRERLKNAVERISKD
jgi:DNA-directed RNA polymerase specialized sigma24 family protein